MPRRHKLAYHSSSSAAVPAIMLSLDRPPLRSIELMSQEAGELPDIWLSGHGAVVAGNDANLNVGLGHLSPAQGLVHGQVGQQLLVCAIQGYGHWQRLWSIGAQCSQVRLEQYRLLFGVWAKVEH